MTRGTKILLALTLLMVGLCMFVAGRAVERYQYEEACLDLGGGRHPGDYPICIMEQLSD
ncbi:hypothetical protein [Ruegeria arenilitoris]|uniref:hypothetical protein n=1 Tax=Ruegeria arenilitoris TaxID=1173585 RepID=UPI0014815B7B|nr:hypothetical protein [Ruegeria arenilitoris]